MNRMRKSYDDFEPETRAYAQLPSPGINIALADSYIKLIKYSTGITLSSVTANRSDVAGGATASGGAFVSNPSVDLRPYVGFKLTTNDGGVGWIKSAGTGEDVSGGDLLNGWNLTDAIWVAQYSTTKTNATTLTCAAGQTNLAVTNITFLSIGNLYKGSFSGTAESGTARIDNSSLPVTYLVNGEVNKYFTAVETAYWKIRNVATSEGKTLTVASQSVYKVLTPSLTGVVIWNKTLYNWVAVGTTPNAASFTYTITKD